MRFRWACLTLCASQFLGCENPRPVLTRVEPAEAYSDANVRLTLFGEGFIPATTLDPISGSRVAVVDGFHARVGNGQRWADLANLAWLAPGQMTGSLLGQDTSKSDFPTGPLNVELTDPRGQSDTLTGVFNELGHDSTPPTITFTSPAVKPPVGPGTVLLGSFHASDASPGMLASLSWTYHEPQMTSGPTNCPLAAPSAQADCTFQITVSQSLSGNETIWIEANAADASKNHTQAILSFPVLARATVASISPSSGGTAGGTDVVITGSGFIAGSQAILDGVPMFPEGGIIIDEQTMSAHVPAHDAGATPILVRTPLGTALGTLFFTYLPPPLLETIAPDTGSAAGGTAVVLTGKNFTADTQIFLGATLESAVPLYYSSRPSGNAIIGRTPPGSGQTTVWAFDEALGFTRLSHGFTWRTP